MNASLRDEMERAYADQFLVFHRLSRLVLDEGCRDVEQVATLLRSWRLRTLARLANDGTTEQLLIAIRAARHWLDELLQIAQGSGRDGVRRALEAARTECGNAAMCEDGRLHTPQVFRTP